MIRIRHSEDRGQADHGWLKAKHSFSFGHYYDEEHMGFRNLRVINEDRVAPRTGFTEHGHQDMEIITYVLSGMVEHKDSEGNVGHIKSGMVQRMSAGTGIRHSEMNPTDEELHLLQIWILPEKRGIAPGYEEKVFPQSCGEDRLQLVAARDGRDGALTMYADAELWAGTLSPGTTVVHELCPDRHAWVQVARGTVELDGHTLTAGDGASISDLSQVEIKGLEEAEVLVFDLP
ncbi:MAG: pirin family protein [Planctomycetota bacterium]